MVFNGTPIRSRKTHRDLPPFGQPCLLVFTIPGSELERPVRGPD
jgi:hypothetical protein